MISSAPLTVSRTGAGTLRDATASGMEMPACNARRVPGLARGS